MFQDSGVPVFTSFALWSGGLAVFVLLAPLWRRTREAAKSSGAIAFRSALSGTLLGAMQGTVAGLVLPLSLHYSSAQFFGFLTLSVLAGIAFGLVNQGLVALFAGLGRFVALLLLTAALVTGVVSTVPGPIQALVDFTPLGTAFSGYQAVAGGGR